MANPRNPRASCVSATGLTCNSLASANDLTVLQLSLQRGSATVARTMYAESPESLAAREKALQQRRLAPEPAAALGQGRPTKRDRRALASWQRWSASVEP